MIAFLMIFRRFPKLFWRPDERSRTFSENFRKFPTISEDCRRLSRKTRRCFDNTPTILSTIFKRQTWYQWNHQSISSHVRISFLWICYHSVYHWLLYNKYMLFAGLGSVRIVKSYDRGLENAALGLRPRAAFSSPRSQFFTIQTDPKPANNLLIFFLR